ncbi:hypothetical protein PEPS_01980 [Persicobacter psychrovividus]|uniref:Uncharacterized protein n=1 Tax=Persicobacter psychrovividus TaxID=387638 RepID=A0ABM7VAH5_9BACT|nr:hypothetical protein PEPS_01980 [Persicobacter psychrovividus]
MKLSQHYFLAIEANTPEYFRNAAKVKPLYVAVFERMRP